MEPRLLTAASLLFFYLAYRFYGNFLATKVFRLDEGRTTPAVEKEDGYDFLPTRAPVLFGHHFASIAGLGPIVGPALAVIWGWLPALVWIVLGSALVGAVHDFATLVLSIRHGGRSVGDVTESLVNKRARFIFLSIIFFMLSLSMGVFVHVIALLFSSPVAGARFYPEAVFPSAALIIIAMFVGYLVHERSFRLKPVTAVGVLLMLLSIYAGTRLPLLGWTVNDWKPLLLIYACIASILPVWLLLQPRDYINAFELYLGGALLYLGFFLSGPTFKAPVLNSSVSDLPPLLPFIFITLACGACSGFHSLVSSGTTSKQLAHEQDALPIGYGSMLAEGALALIVLMACACGGASSQAWHARYSSFSAASGLGPKLQAFIDGGSSFVAFIGVPRNLAANFIAVVIVSFALTTLDSATRLLSYNIEEIIRALGVKRLPWSRGVSSLLAVAAIAYFAFMTIGGKPAGLALWQLFGVSNQLLAALGLLIATVYLLKKARPVYTTFIPLVFMLSVSTWAIVLKLKAFASTKGHTHLLVVGLAVTILAAWLVLETLALSFSGLRRRETKK